MSEIVSTSDPVPDGYADVGAVESPWRRRATQLADEVASSAGATAVLAAAAALGHARSSGARLPLRLLSAAAAGALAWSFRDSAHRLERLTRSAEDAAVLSAALGTAAPLFGRWAAEGDFAGLIARELERSPSLVVECGSGSTTLVIADRLRQNGSGRIVSLEHDHLYANRTRQLLAAAGLAGVARVVDAPLRRQLFGERSVEWYERSVVDEAIDAEIDVLVVDGPPQVSPWARWPAIQVFHDRLADDFVALLDDGRARETSRAVHAWAEEFPDVDLYWLDTVKGTWLLKRREGSAMSGPLLRIARFVNPRPAGSGRWPVHR